MKKDEAILQSRKRPNHYGVPSMIEYNRAIRAMDIYADSKLENVNKIHTMPVGELREKLLSLLYQNGVDSIVQFIKGEF